MSYSWNQAGGGIFTGRGGACWEEGGDICLGTVLVPRDVIFSMLMSASCPLKWRQGQLQSGGTI